MQRRTAGFTIVELIFVIVVGSILTLLALSSFQGARGRYQVLGAKTMYMTVHQRARSQAIEFGETVMLRVDVQGDSVWIWSPSRGTDEAETVRFRSRYNVDIATTSNANFLMCMTPRGYADPDCGSIGAADGTTQTFSAPFELTFVQANDTARVDVLPFGQVVGE